MTEGERIAAGFRAHRALVAQFGEDAFPRAIVKRACICPLQGRTARKLRVRNGRLTRLMRRFYIVWSNRGRH